jgi:hypothetical protein
MKDGGGKGSEELANKLYTKLELQRNLLEKEEEKIKKLKEQEREYIQKSRDAIAEMANFDASKATKEEILGVIKRCSKAIANLKKQWQTLSMFFDSINNVISHTLTEQMSKFKDLADTQLKNNKPISSMAYHQLISPAQDSTKFAYCVEQVSLLYCDISKEHFIPMVTEFSKLLALDSNDDKAEIDKLKKEMDCQAKRAVEAIEKKIMLEKDHLTERIHARASKCFEFLFCCIFKKRPTVVPVILSTKIYV